MENKETAGKILNNLKSKFRSLNQVYDLTKELERALENGDEGSLEIVLDMRQKQLELCMDIDRQNEELVGGLTEAEKIRVNTLLRTQGKNPEPDGEDEEEIYAMTKRIKNLLIKTVDYDKKVNSRVNK